MCSCFLQGQGVGGLHWKQPQKTFISWATQEPRLHLIQGISSSACDTRAAFLWQTLFYHHRELCCAVVLPSQNL